MHFGALELFQGLTLRRIFEGNLLIYSTSRPDGRPHIPDHDIRENLPSKLTWIRFWGGYRFKCKPLPLCLLKSVAEQAQVLDGTLGCHLVAPPGGVMRVIPSPLPPTQTVFG